MAKTAAKRLHDDDEDRGAETSTFNAKLKTFGVDTDVMAEAAKEQAGDLQQLLAEELKKRPLRALGIAAAVGLFAGLIVSR